MKILLLKFRHIGDVLLITPLLENLKAHYGESCEIGVALNEGCEGIIMPNPLITRLHRYPRGKIAKANLRERIALEWGFVREIRATKYDLVLALTEGERSAFLSLLSGASLRVGYAPKKRLWRGIYHHFIAPQGERHTVESNLDALRALGIPILHKRVRATLGEGEALPPLPSEFIHIHPVSRWLFKCVDDSLMAGIMERLWEEFGLESVMTCSDDPKEKEKCQRIASLMKRPPVMILGTLSLPQISALNQRARAFIGVDTAIMHLSAANAIPVFAFFGPSGAFHWGAWDNERLESGYRNRHGLQRMGRHRVYQESRPCIPCGKAGCENSGRSECLLEIPLEAAWSEIATFIKELKCEACR